MSEKLSDEQKSEIAERVTNEAAEVTAAVERSIEERRDARIAELLDNNATLEQRVGTAETVIERRDAKIKRQAEQITRLETSRADLRKALTAEDKA